MMAEAECRFIRWRITAKRSEQLPYFEDNAEAIQYNLFLEQTFVLVFNQLFTTHLF